MGGGGGAEVVSKGTRVCWEVIFFRGGGGGGGVAVFWGGGPGALRCWAHALMTPAGPPKVAPVGRRLQISLKQAGPAQLCQAP